MPDQTQVSKPQRRRSGAPNPPRRAHRGGRIVALIALVLGVALIWFLAELFQPFHGDGHGSVLVTIPAHSSSGKVGDVLEHDGVISSSFFFQLRATLGGDRDRLRSGTYHLKQGMSYGAALKVLTTVPPAPSTTALTIVEGRTRRQIDTLLRSEGVKGSYLKATRRSPLLSPHTYGAPRNTDSLEGFLFPETYELREPISIGALVADQLRTFRRRFAEVKLGYARRKRMSAYDVLIIASMVQAEAQTAHDRPLVASVIYNRLAAGMPLQIDATTRYAANNYTAPLTQAQLNSSSPFNTRIHKGLPPTPISNPGMDAIQAAAHPRQTNYLFFVVKPCGNGEHVFATNYRAFLAATKRYQSARAKRGGRSPAQC